MRVAERFGLLILAWGALSSCDRAHGSEGGNLARTYCSACHAFPDPTLLDKKTWESGVLPQMAPRLGVRGRTLFEETSRNPLMVVLPKPIAEADWKKLVEFYLDSAPDKLPDQKLPAQLTVDPSFFATSEFAPGTPSSGIITLLKIDSVRQRIFIGEGGGNNSLRIFDWNRRLLSTITLASPPTDLIADDKGVLVLESGILDPNDQPRGSLVRYEVGADGSLRETSVLIDSLFRPVFAEQFDFDGDGQKEFVICEFGNNRGRLAIYKYDGSRYVRSVLDPNPGAIKVEIRDLTGDGAPDIVALLAQGDERIVLFENDGKGNFTGRQRVLARFPPVYGSMYFSMHDFNGDGKLDIVYANGDNFDYSRVLKPYHGVRILENDGKNDFRERYFFPIYGAARAEVADFDGDGDPDILATSNFADAAHPERGIIYLENDGGYAFRAFAFGIAAANQWNLTAAADLDHDGRTDVIVGAMDLASVGQYQRFPGQTLEKRKNTIVLFENKIGAKPRAAGH